MAVRKACKTAKKCRNPKRRTVKRVVRRTVKANPRRTVKRVRRNPLPPRNPKTGRFVKTRSNPRKRRVTKRR